MLQAIVGLVSCSAFPNPLASARGTLWLMNANQLSTTWTGPAFLFIPGKVPYAAPLYILQVVNYAHAILGSVTFIQVAQVCAGKAVTTEAVLGFPHSYHLTVSYFAHNATFRSEPIVSAATRARLLVSCVSPTKATIHSAGSSQFRGYCVCLSRHIPIAQQRRYGSV